MAEVAVLMMAAAVPAATAVEIVVVRVHIVEGVTAVAAAAVEVEDVTNGSTTTITCVS